MRIAAPILLLALSLALGGCIILPVPLPACNPDEFCGRDEVSPQALQSLRDGASTRESILLALGEPDRSWDSGRFFLYVGNTAHGVVIAGFMGPTGGSAGGHFYTGDKYLLLMEFDPRGVLARHEVQRTALDRPRTEVTQMADQWAYVRSTSPASR